MSDLTIEGAGLYSMFYEAADGVEVEIDAEGVWVVDEKDETALKDVSDDVRNMYYRGMLETPLLEIRKIAAVAFCEAAIIKPYDYGGAGGEKYEDD